MTRVRVVLVDHLRGTKTQVEVPDNVSMSRLVPALVSRLGLPTDQDGATVTYRLDNRDTGERIGEEQTLAEAGVQDGTILALAPELPEHIQRLLGDEEISKSMAVVNIQAYFGNKGWRVEKKRAVLFGDVLHFTQVQEDTDDLHLYVLITEQQAYLQLFVTDVRPACRLAVYKLLFQMNRGVQTVVWCADQYDQVFVETNLSLGSFSGKYLDVISAEDKQGSQDDQDLLEPLIESFTKRQKEISLVAQDPQSAELILQHVNLVVDAPTPRGYIAT